MSRRKHLEVCTPAMKRKPQFVLAHFFKDALPHRKAALTANVHLDEIRAALIEQIHETRLIRLVLTCRDRKLGRLLQPHIRVVILWRQRFLQPSRCILRHRVGQVQNRLRRIRFIAHAPPRMRVNHQANIRPHCGTHLSNRFQVSFRAAGRAHFVSGKTQSSDRRSLLGKPLRLHVHSRAAIEFNPIPLGSARNLAQRTTLITSYQIHYGDLHRAIRLRQFKIALKIKTWPSAWLEPFKERTNNLANLPRRPFMSRPRGKTSQAVVSRDTNVHRIALQHRAHPTIKRQYQRLRQWTGD